MTKAPESLYVEISQHPGEWTGTAEQVTEFDIEYIEYIRSDLIPSLLAAEREKALREAASLIRRYMLDAGVGSKPFIELNNEMAKAILALIDAEAKPSLPS